MRSRAGFGLRSQSALPKVRPGRRGARRGLGVTPSTPGGLGLGGEGRAHAKPSAPALLGLGPTGGGRAGGGSGSPLSRGPVASAATGRSLVVGWERGVWRSIPAPLWPGCALHSHPLRTSAGSSGRQLPMSPSQPVVWGLLSLSLPRTESSSCSKSSPPPRTGVTESDLREEEPMAGMYRREPSLVGDRELLAGLLRVLGFPAPFPTETVFSVPGQGTVGPCPASAGSGML